MLKDNQKKAILEQDKSAKEGYLNAAPQISNAAVKGHPKYQAYAASMAAQH